MIDSLRIDWLSVYLCAGLHCDTPILEAVTLQMPFGCWVDTFVRPQFPAIRALYELYYHHGPANYEYRVQGFHAPPFALEFTLRFKGGELLVLALVDLQTRHISGHTIELRSRTHEDLEERIRETMCTVWNGTRLRRQGADQRLLELFGLEIKS